MTEPLAIRWRSSSVHISSILLPLAILCILLLGATPAKTKGEQYADDFNMLVVSLQELHPLLYKTIGKNNFDRQVETTRRKLLQTEDESDAIYMMQELMYNIGDAHSANISVYDVRRDTTIRNILPFSVYIINHDLYIKDYPRDTTYIGTQVLSIENTDASLLIDSFRIFFPNDGARDILDFRVQPFFNALYAKFCNQHEAYTLTTTKGKITVEAAKKGTSLFDLLMNKTDSAYLGNDRILKTEINSDYGYFSFAGFIPQYRQYTIEKDYDSLITILIDKQVPNLIIDLRHNEGGDPEMGARMVSYLRNERFRIFNKMYEAKCGKPTFEKYISGSKLYYRARNIRTRNAGELREVVRMERQLRWTNPNVQQYTGHIYILTGSVTKSASTMFCKYLIGQSNVTFVGSETSGAINYFWAGGPNGAYCELTLPSLKTKFGFAIELNELKAGSSANELPIGLIPDQIIEYTIEDLMAHRNLELDWIKSDIAQK